MKKLIYKLKSGWWLTLYLFLLTPRIILAVGITTGDGGGCGNKLCNPLNGTSDLYGFIAKILDAVSQLGAVVVVFFIIYAGFLFVTAQGNEEKLSTAKKAILYTLIGAAILLGAKAISEMIKATINEIK